MLLTRDPGVLTPALIACLRAEYRLDWNGVHGVAHWARVRVNGLRLALHNGADTRIVEYFAFLHDACRRTEGRDPEHGPRAAELAHRLRSRHIALEDEAFAQLVAALEGHTYGIGHDSLTVCTCWDADRLDLPRVSIEVDPVRLCTHEARDPALIARSRNAALDWLENFRQGSFAGQEIRHAAPAVHVVR